MGAGRAQGGQPLDRSLLALDPDTGKIKWGFQYTPNDPWDYDGVNAPILIDTTHDGKSLKAAVQVNRNGFLYVINRENGKFVSATPMIPGINWTSGIDPASGKPTINEAMKPKAGGEKVMGIVPGLEGGTNWFPPAYNPDLGYVFLNTNHWGMSMKGWAKDKIKYQPGSTFMEEDYQMYRLGAMSA